MEDFILNLVGSILATLFSESIKKLITKWFDNNDDNQHVD